MFIKTACNRSHTLLPVVTLEIISSQSFKPEHIPFQIREWKWLTALIRQTDGSSFLTWMWDRPLCSCRAQVHHTDLWHVLHRGHGELRHVNWDTSLSHAVIHKVTVALEPEAGRKKNKQKALQLNSADMCQVCVICKVVAPPGSLHFFTNINNELERTLWIYLLVSKGVVCISKYFYQFWESSQGPLYWQGAEWWYDWGGRVLMGLRLHSPCPAEW